MNTFESAVDAVVAGDPGTLASFLHSEPELVRARSTRPHRATLLHYLGANGVEDERQRSPRNAVEIAELLLSSGADVNATAEMYGGSTTLDLVASSIHPLRAGVQIPLLKALIDHGAKTDGAVAAALHNGRKQASEFLAQHGAQLDLEAAAGVGRLDLVKNLQANAGKSQLELGFLWACEYGRLNVVEYLVDHGVDLSAEANTGLTGLHWAAVGGQTAIVEFLLQRGASAAAVNKYGGTALGQAQWSASNGDSTIDYAPVIAVLERASAIQS